jgi:hypothetical protein
METARFLVPAFILVPFVFSADGGGCHDSLLHLQYPSYRHYMVPFGYSTVDICSTIYLDRIFRITFVGCPE